jgi:hypothetical protein
MPLTTEPNIAAYVGKSIGDICENHYNTTHQNHCAHFVSHALSIQLPILCGDMKFETRHTGATIRCHELFNQLVDRGTWNKRPKGRSPLLIFIISAAQVRNNIMHNVPQKHVGIYFSGPVYNYSNMHQKVVTDQSVDAFFKQIDNLYTADDISLYYGVPR